MLRSPDSSAYSTSTDLSPPFTYSTTRPPTAFSPYISHLDSTSEGVSTATSGPRSRSWSRSTSTSSHWGKSPHSPPQTPVPPIPISKFPRDDDVQSDGRSADLCRSSDLSAYTPYIHTSAGDTPAYTAKSGGGSRTSYKPSSRPLDTIAPDTPATTGWPAKTPTTTNRDQLADQQRAVMDSPYEITPATTAQDKRAVSETQQYVTSEIESADERREHEQRGNSTLPSVFSISQLAKANTKTKIVSPVPRTLDRKGQVNNLVGEDGEKDSDRVGDRIGKPSADMGNLLRVDIPNTMTSENEGVHPRKPYTKSRTPDISRQQTKLLDIKDQNKLGRMSVATRRYTLPPQRNSRVVHAHAQAENAASKSESQSRSGSRTSKNASDRSSRTLLEQMNVYLQGWTHRFWMYSLEIFKSYLTYRPFIAPFFSLYAALLLTMTHSMTPDSSLGHVVRVDKDVFDISRAGGTDVVLGVWGWCQANVSEPQCQNYGFRDFANDQLTFTIPGDPSLEALSLLLTALTVSTWLLASYQIQDADDVDPAVVEVDLRVKCQRFPYESYLWVWWAWWGHRRAPIQSIFGVLVGILSWLTFGIVYRFKSIIVEATQSHDVALGTGAYMPLLTALVTLDTFILSVRYLWNFRHNFRTFLNPPDPSPRVLLLPASENAALQHHRRTGLQSFFAPISAITPSTNPTRGQGNHKHNYEQQVSTKLLGGGNEKNINVRNRTEQEKVLRDLDEETVRWLEAYPSDEELFDLINALKSGGENGNGNGGESEYPDFILSEIGLLYLRPRPEPHINGGIISDGDALLIPPKGIIREELLEDAHLDVYPGISEENRDCNQNQDQATDQGDHLVQDAHNELEIMIVILSKNFWWNGMEIDCKEYIEGCQVCFENLRERQGRLNKQFHVG
ncbi:uncharacterized protein I303_100558 [Kwoniella dejecticola CBS 10117]|uniref:Integrase zinc-binding domain-containing protein n=1 Tax=Kwoniella dejecticola CBS 10117 TaxID=1296121 RepID=A0AAJ8KI07_9TREE